MFLIYMISLLYVLEGEMDMNIIIIVLGYLLGSIPSGLIVGKIWFNIDIREHGSGNLGATNSFRILGTKAGIAVTLADILKGTLAACLPLIFNVDMNMLLIGVCAIIGHTYPIFAKFRGGKAVATSAGVVLACEPLIFTVLLAIFIVCLLVTKMVSLTSMITAAIAVLAVLTTGDLLTIIVICAVASFIFYRHRTNIKRIINKTEPKVTFLSKNKSK